MISERELAILLSEARYKLDAYRGSEPEKMFQQIYDYLRGLYDALYTQHFIERKIENIKYKLQQGI